MHVFHRLIERGLALLAFALVLHCNARLWIGVPATSRQIPQRVPCSCALHTPGPPSAWLEVRDADGSILSWPTSAPGRTGGGHPKTLEVLKIKRYKAPEWVPGTEARSNARCCSAETGV